MAERSGTPTATRPVCAPGFLEKDMKAKPVSPWRKWIPGLYAKAPAHPVPHRDRMGIK